MVSAAGLDRSQAKFLIVSLVLLAELVFLIFQLLSLYLVTSTYAVKTLGQEVGTVTEQVSTRVTTMVDDYSTAVSWLARDPEIVNLVTSRNKRSLHAMETILRQDFPAAINVRLLPPGLVSLDKTSSPPISYAALDQMRMAEENAQAPPLAVHLFSTPQQHINIVHPLIDPANVVVGHLMLALSFDVLGDIFEELDKLQGYIELQQVGTVGSPIIVAMQGNVENRTGEVARTIPIEGSLWQVSYWTPASNTIYLGSISVWLLGALLLVSFGLIKYIVSLFQRVIDDSITA